MSKDPEMEKNYWLALILSMIVLLAYPMILKKTGHAPQPAIENTSAEKAAALTQAISAAVPAEKKAEAAVVPFSSSQYDIRFSTQGAVIKELIYKGEKNKIHVQVPFYITESDGGIFSSKILNQETDLTKEVFQLERKGENVFEFTFEKPGDYRFTKRYTFAQDEPAIKLEFLLQNLTDRERAFPLEISYAMYYADSHAAHHIDVESVYFQEKVKSTKLNTIQKKGFTATGGMEWTGLLKKYFSILVKPDWAILSEENSADSEIVSSKLLMEPVTVAPTSTSAKSLFVYAGPQRYETLKNLKMDFELILSRGFFGLFKIWLLVSLKFFNQYTHNFGWAIILLTVVLKLLFTPLTHMSYASMRKMQAIQPKMKSIQERYKSDPAKMNREVMELYRRNKVNPMGGCLPMLAQIPIFIAFYQVLNETIELKGAPFIYWIHDLAEPDKLLMFPFTVPFVNIHSLNILPLLMAFSMFWQQKVTPQPSASSEQAQMMKFMPLVMGVILYNMPSGLALYWFVNNMLTVGHQLIIKRMGDVILHHEDRD